MLTNINKETYCINILMFSGDDGQRQEGRVAKDASRFHRLYLLTIIQSEQ